LEEDVARQQADEDLRLYGTRPEPPDFNEVDETTTLADFNLPSKRTLSDFEAAVDHPAKVRKKGESKGFSYQSVTAMDWNSGSSPLEAWLNQSAVPAATSVAAQYSPVNAEKAMVAQEIGEMKVFRNVHMTKEQTPMKSSQGLVDMEELELGAQIYYRNIVDRYPLLPAYLARRLAQANHDRAERLRYEKSQGREMARDYAMRKSASHVQDHINKRPPAFSLAHKPSHKPKIEVIRPHACVESAMNRPCSPSDFWTGRSSRRHSASVHSRSSSMNSSLHGEPKYDPQEQNPTFPSVPRASSSGDFATKPSLPPPPVELGKVLTFTCDMCESVVQVKTRHEWQ